MIPIWVRSGKVPDISWYGCSKFNLGSHHICLSTNHMMEICQGHCVCNGNTNMAYKSQRDVTSASLCVRADGVDGYCLVLLLGNGRATLWCNRGYEHICHSTSLYLKEKRGHWSLREWGGVSGFGWWVPPCRWPSALLSADLVTAPTRTGQWWRHDPFPLGTMADVEVHGAFFPIVSCLCWSASSPRLWMDTGAWGPASEAADTFMRPKYWWVIRGGHRGRKEDKLSR